jgi:hypothetical protein
VCLGSFLCRGRGASNESNDVLAGIESWIPLNGRYLNKSPFNFFVVAIAVSVNGLASYHREASGEIMLHDLQGIEAQPVSN